MRIVLQRVQEAQVEINQGISGAIEQGYLILVGLEEADNSEDIDWILRKIINLRLFSDEEGKMNLNLEDVGGSLLIVSQFTLHAKYKKGNRPSFIRAAKPEQAIPLYEELLKKAELMLPGKIQSGEFGADMQVKLVNDGPVTLTMDTKNKE